jgi:hypothetical protein
MGWEATDNRSCRQLMVLGQAEVGRNLTPPQESLLGWDGSCRLGWIRGSGK